MTRAKAYLFGGVELRWSCDESLANDDAPEIRKLFTQHYRGSRYSFGYPACPDMSDQEPGTSIPGPRAWRNRKVADPDVAPPAEQLRPLVSRADMAARFVGLTGASEARTVTVDVQLTGELPRGSTATIDNRDELCK